MNNLAIFMLFRHGTEVGPDQAGTMIYGATWDLEIMRAGLKQVPFHPLDTIPW